MSQPGIIFGLNDSGHRPRIFAFDSAGQRRGVWNVVGARNRDWEAASLGPCPAPRRTCLFIGDTGDNDARRPDVTLYRVTEPVVPAAGDPVGTLQVDDALTVRYPDRPHDVEAMYVTADGSVFLITKRRLLDAERRPRRALIFGLAPAAWDSSGAVTARLVDSLPIIPGERQGGQISDAALSPDGTLLAIRTYADVFIFVMDSARGVPAPGQSPVPCTLRALNEKQGEGIGWWWDRRRLVLTSERRGHALHVVACPLPTP